MLKVRRHSARAKFWSALKRGHGVAKLGWHVGAVQAGRSSSKTRSLGPSWVLVGSGERRRR